MYRTLERQETEDRSQRTEVGGRRSNVGDLKFRKTWDIIEAVEKGLLPDRIMINSHPEMVE